MEEAIEYLNKYSNEKIDTSKIDKAEKKSNNLKDKANDFKLLLSMFKDGVSGRYPISKGTLATIGGAIVYVVSPIDAIPDILPVVGWTDDVAIVGIVLAKLKIEIEKYKVFKK